MSLIQCDELLCCIYVLLAKEPLDPTRSLRALFRTCKHAWHVFSTHRNRIANDCAWYMDTDLDLCIVQGSFSIGKQCIVYRDKWGFLFEANRIDGKFYRYSFVQSLFEYNDKEIHQITIYTDCDKCKDQKSLFGCGPKPCIDLRRDDRILCEQVRENLQTLTIQEFLLQLPHFRIVLALANRLTINMDRFFDASVSDCTDIDQRFFRPTTNRSLGWI